MALINIAVLPLVGPDEAQNMWRYGDYKRVFLL